MRNLRYWQCQKNKPQKGTITLLKCKLCLFLFSFWCVYSKVTKIHILHSQCLSVHLCICIICLLVTTSELLNGFSWNLNLGGLLKTCSHILILVMAFMFCTHLECNLLSNYPYQECSNKCREKWNTHLMAVHFFHKCCSFLKCHQIFTFFITHGTLTIFLWIIYSDPRNISIWIIFPVLIASSVCDLYTFHIVTYFGLCMTYRWAWASP